MSPREGLVGILSCKMIASLMRFREIRGGANMRANSKRNENLRTQVSAVNRMVQRPTRCRGVSRLGVLEEPDAS